MDAFTRSEPHSSTHYFFYFRTEDTFKKNIVRCQSKVVEGFLLDGFKLRGVAYIWATMVAVKSYCFYLQRAEVPNHKIILVAVRNSPLL